MALGVKNTPANAGDLRDTGSVPGSGRSPGGGHRNPLKHSFLENPMDRGAWRAAVRGVSRSQQWLGTNAFVSALSSAWFLFFFFTKCLIALFLMSLFLCLSLSFSNVLKMIVSNILSGFQVVPFRTISQVRLNLILAKYTTPLIPRFLCHSDFFVLFYIKVTFIHNYLDDPPMQGLTTRLIDLLGLRDLKNC